MLLVSTAYSIGCTNKVKQKHAASKVENPFPRCSRGAHHARSFPPLQTLPAVAGGRDGDKKQRREVAVRTSFE